MKAFLLRSCLLLTALPALVRAQPDRLGAAFTPPLRPIEEVRELTFGGSGGGNRRLNDSFVGLAVGYGDYFNNEWQGVIRQSFNYHDRRRGSTRWSGSTQLAADYHVTTLGMVMPFFGASFGRIYGSALRDTWSAGLEAGVKYYMYRKRFVFGRAEYNWLFQRTRNVDGGNAQIMFTAGVGFNF